MNGKFLALIVVFAANFRLCYGKEYKDYSLFKVIATDERQLEFLQSLEEKKYMDSVFLEVPTALNQTVSLLVHNKAKDPFFAESKTLNLQVTEVIRDVDDAFKKQFLRQCVDEENWSQIPTLEQVYSWLNKTNNMYSNITKLEIIGKSFEKRPLYAFTIMEQKKHDNLKIIMEAGLHGNEWHGVVFSLYYINNLLRTNDETIIRVREKYNWYFLPVMNPDGYKYSQTEDRLWKKNRRKVKGKCIGVDLNRNFDHKFGTYDASRSPTHMHYAGPSAFSESETQALRDFITRKRDSLIFYFSLHGSGQKFLIPYSDIKNHVSNYLEVQDYAKQASERIRAASGRRYCVGNAYDLYGTKISGDSISWVKKNFFVPYVLGMSFRNEDESGLALLVSEIRPACEEMKQGISSLLLASPKNLRGHKFGGTLFNQANVAFIFILSFVIILLNC